MSKVKALWDYEAGESNEISFKQGDEFTLVIQHNNDWWEGEINNMRGFFPANRVELIKKDESEMKFEDDSKLPTLPPAPETAANKGDDLNKSMGGTSLNESANSKRLSSSSASTEDGAIPLEPPPVSTIRKEGFLGRRSAGTGMMTLSIRSWRSLWVEQANDILYFFKDPQNKKAADKRDKPVDVVDLKKCVVDNSGKMDKKKTIFTITTADDNIVTLQAASETEMVGWTNSICEAPGARIEELGVMGAKTMRGKHKTLKKRVQTDAKPKNLGGVKEEGDAGPKNEVPEDAPFGGNLIKQLEKDGRKVPLILERCARVIEDVGLKVPGIYRMSGNATGIQRLKTAFNADPEKVNWADPLFQDVHVFSGALKLYFRELSNPLLTFEKYDEFVAAGKIEDPKERAGAIKKIYATIPQQHKDTCMSMIAHLRRIIRSAGDNKMDAANLAVVFGPTLLRSKKEADLENVLNLGFQNAVIETMLVQSNEIFM